MGLEADKLDQILLLLRKHDVAEFVDGDLKIKLNPERIKHTGIPGISDKPNKTPEQEQEELLFWSANK